MPKTSKKNRKSRSSSNDAGLTREGINRPTEHDVLQGRGGQANNWIGNKTYRRAVDARKAEYVQCQRAQKTALSVELVRNWRAMNPPGRFLEQDADGVWHEIGDKKARRKTSQLLRENAPIIRESMGLPDPQPLRQQRHHHDSGADSTGTEDSQDEEDEEEWLPKASSRRNGKRRASANRSKEPPQSTRRGSVQHPHPYEPKPHYKNKKPKPPTMAATSAAGPSGIKSTAKLPSGLDDRDTNPIQWQASLKPPPLKAANAAKKKKRAGRNETTASAQGPSSMSKRDLYLAMKHGTLETKAKTVSKPPPKLEGSITMMPHLNTQETKAKAVPKPPPKQEASATIMSRPNSVPLPPVPEGWDGLPPALAQHHTETKNHNKTTKAQQQVTRSDQTMPMYPQLPPGVRDPNLLLPIEEDDLRLGIEHPNQHPVEEDQNMGAEDTNPLSIEEDLKLPDTEPLSTSDPTMVDQKPPAVALGRVPFGTTLRDMSWPSMPMAHFDQTTDTSLLLGDLTDLENLGFGGAPPAPLGPFDFENRVREGPGSPDIMEEDHNGRRFGGLFVTDDCNMMDISQNSC